MPLTLELKAVTQIERSCMKLQGVIDLLSACRKDELRDDAINLVAMVLDDVLRDIEMELKLR